MKNKGVMVSLAAIVLIGMIITTGTYNFIEKNSSESQGASQAAAAAMDGAGGAGETEAKLPQESLTAAAMGRAGAMEEEAAPEDARGEHSPDRENGGSPEPELYASAENNDAGDSLQKEGTSVLTSGMEEDGFLASPSGVAVAEEAASEEFEENAAADLVIVESQSYYVKRLQDLDSQIQKNKETQTGDNTNSSVKSAASNELKLWDSELNDIYNAILEKLEQEESEELVKEERAWLKERDSLAMEAAKKSAGGSSESIEYTISLTESTRRRAYELAERYARVLEE